MYKIIGKVVEGLMLLLDLAILAMYGLMPVVLGAQGIGGMIEGSLWGWVKAVGFGLLTAFTISWIPEKIINIKKYYSDLIGRKHRDSEDSQNNPTSFNQGQP